MPAAFYSIGVALPADAAHRLTTWARRLERLGALVDADEQTVFSFDDDRPFDLGAVSRAYQDGPPAAAAFENAFVDADPGEVLSRIPGNPTIETCISHGAAIFVVLDRVIAIPRGFELMGGHAVARLRANDVGHAARAWAQMIDDVGGIGAIEQIAVRYLRAPSGADLVRQALSAIDAIFRAAEGSGHDAVLITCRS